MKHIALALSMMLIGATAASAQSIEIRPGRSDGPSIGIGSDRHRDSGRSMRGSDDENRGMRRGQREDRVIVRYDRTVAHAPVLVDYVTFGLDETPPGEYRLILEITDRATGKTVERVQRFVIR